MNVGAGGSKFGGPPHGRTQTSSRIRRQDSDEEMHQEVTLSVAQEESNCLSIEVLDTYTRLHDLLERYEPLLHKRWKGKGLEQRRRLLKQAWPEIHTAHRPDWAALMSQEEWKLYRKDAKMHQHISAFLWPNLNLEDLGDNRRLLVLLKARGRNHPSSFAHSDADSLDFGIGCGAIILKTTRDALASMEGTDPYTYGQIKIRSQLDPTSGEGQREMAGLSSGKCLQVLHLQRHLLNVLLKVSKLMLQDIPETAHAEGPVIAEPSLPEHPDHGTMSLAALRFESSYCPPAILSVPYLDQLLCIAQGHLSDVRDHFHQMREDPDYFCIIGLRFVQHRNEQCQNIIGRAWNIPRGTDSTWWPTLMTGLARRTVLPIAMWRILFDLLVDLKGSLARVDAREPFGADHCAKPLPPSIICALMRINSFLDYSARYFSKMLGEDIIGAPQFASGCRFDENLNIRSKRPKDYNMLHTYVKFLADPVVVEAVGAATLVDEIQNIMDKDPKQRARMPVWIVSIFGEMALIGELKRQLNACQPWASVIRELDPQTYFDPAQGPETAIDLLFEKMGPERTIFVGPDEFLTNKRFDYPIERKRTKQTVHRMRESEANLAEFWNSVGKFLRQLVAEDERLVFLLEDLDREVSMTPEWVEPDQRSSQRPPPAARQSYETATDYSSFEHVSDQRAFAELDLPPQREKVKTRGTASHKISESALIPSVPEPPDTKLSSPEFVLSKRPYKVFQALFHSPEENNAPSEISWTEFLAGMKAVGFKIEKLYGSVWQFSPTMPGATRSIQFHDPHPEPKLAHWQARRIGRRLHRTYGWTSRNFVPE